MENIFNAAASLGGPFEYELRRNGETIDEWSQHNLVPYAALDHNNNVVLSDATRITAWYVALYSNTYTPANDDLYTHIGSRFTEVNAQYSEATRPVWTPDAVDSVNGALSNTVDRATFTFTSGASISGAMLVSSNIKGDAAASNAVMFAASAHSPARTVLAGDELLVKYSFLSTSS